MMGQPLSPIKSIKSEDKDIKKSPIIKKNQLPKEQPILLNGKPAPTTYDEWREYRNYNRNVRKRAIIPDKE